MPSVDDKEIGVARVYSRALLGLAEKEGAADRVAGELDELVSLAAKDPRFARFIESPLVDPEDREKTLETMFRGKASDVLVDALQIMNRKGRLGMLRTMAETYQEAHQGLRGRATAHVASAVELSDALRKRLKKTVAEKIGREVDLVETVDPSLVGGLVVRVGDQKYDTSVRRHIENLHDILVERARQEIYKSRAAEAEA